jgi:hypothetical protein
MVWTGFYLCDAYQSTAPSVQVYLPLTLTIVNKSETGELMTVIDVDYDASVPQLDQSHGSYWATGHYASETCAMLELKPTPNGWIEQTQGSSKAPNPLFAYQLTGKFSEDREWYSGQIKPNPACQCLGRAAPHEANPAAGTSCALWGRATEWCYVSEGCPTATQSLLSAGRREGRTLGETVGL